MGYLHIENLYRCQDILLFKECYALEKIHGTSAHVAWDGKELEFFPGGISAVMFEALFNKEELKEHIVKLGHAELVVHGEAYGGSCQKMAHVYGKQLKFAVFDIKTGAYWLKVPDMVEVATLLGLECVHFERIPTDVAAIDAQRDAHSVQAVRNGMGDGHKREGIVLRPLIEVQMGGGERVIAKHKRQDFSERATPQEIGDPAKLKVLAEAKAIADEWVTPMRLEHVLDKLPQGLGLEGTRKVVDAMIEDVLREANGEIVDSKDARGAVGRRAAQLFKERVTSVKVE